MLSACLWAARGGAGALLLAMSVPAQAADTWPVKAVRIVVPFTAGSATDVVARAFTDRLSAAIGQPVVVDNRPGAGGTIGAAVVAKADPDGYTLLVQSASHTVTPTTYPHLPYDTLRDFAAITPIAEQPNVLIVSAARGIHSLKALIDLAKARPGTLNYASAGAGSATQLNAERFRLAAGFDAVHVPFKGTPEAVTEVLTGRVDYYFCPVVSALPQIKEGKLLALAMGSPKRSSVLPDVPTTEELGVPNSAYNFWVGMFAPARTPRPVIDKIYQSTRQVLQSPEVRDRYAKLGADEFPMTPAEFDAYIRKEVVSNAELIKAANVTVQ